MKRSAKYYRARLDVIAEQIRSIPSDQADKNNNLAILRNGVFPKALNEEKLVNDKLLKKDYSDEPLQFEEITRFNTWFNVFPEKVAGTEHITSSREFPLTIKGTNSGIIRTISGKKGKNKNNEDFLFLLDLKRKRAASKLKLMN